MGIHLNRIIYTCIFVLFFISANNIFAQKRIISSVGVDFRPSYVTPSKDFFKGENEDNRTINKNISAHLRYSFRFGGNTKFGKLYPKYVSRNRSRLQFLFL